MQITFDYQLLKVQGKKLLEVNEGSEKDPKNKDKLVKEIEGKEYFLDSESGDSDTTMDSASQMDNDEQFDSDEARAAAEETEKPKAKEPEKPKPAKDASSKHVKDSSKHAKDSSKHAKEKTKHAKEPSKSGDSGDVSVDELMNQLDMIEAESFERLQKIQELVCTHSNAQLRVYC
jgi:hypothetical protein